jgi:hypothetical protein
LALAVFFLAVLAPSAVSEVNAQPPGLVSRWTADGTADDSVGGNNGTLVNGASFTPGVIGQAFLFDGVDDLVQAPTTGLPTGNGDRTIAMWVRIDVRVATESFFGGYGNFGFGNQAYLLGATGPQNTFFWSQWGFGLSGPPLQTGRWYHVAVTNVGSSITLYLDGVSIANQVLGGPIATSSNSQFYIGRIPGSLGDTRRLQGAVDDVRIYNRALSAAEIQTVVNETSSSNPPFDYDGDGKSDVSVFRPSTGLWYLLRSTAGYTGMQWGEGTDKITPADYDGDGKTDVAVFRASNSTWYIFNSATQTFSTENWGQTGDLAVPADYDGDGKADVSVYRPSDANWYRKLSGGGFSFVNFGTAEDKPVPSDWDGDGKADIGVFRPSSGIWYFLRTTAGFTGIQWGVGTDIQAPGDYDGDGKTDVAVFRPENGTWYLGMSTLGFASVAWGEAGDIPSAGDFDGDGKTDVAVFRPSNGHWYILNSTAGIADYHFGENGDVPTESAFRY